MNSNSGLRSLRHRVSRFGMLYFGLLLLFAGPLWAADAAKVWLDKMAAAVESLNYEGTLVHMRPGKAETFMVFHRVAEGVATERIVAMDGDGAEIIRTIDEVICIFPASQKVVIDKRGKKTDKQNPLRANLPEYNASMDAQYQLGMQADKRVAGRSARLISIKPKDDYRYEHRIWLDEQTAMPLKTQLIGDDDDMPVEELFFTTILLPELVATEKVRAALDTEGYTLIRNGAHPHQHAEPAGQIAWAATNLPGGFMRTAATLEYMEKSEEPRVHLVYSDGLASVSVFVDAGVGAAEQAEGLTSMGAANAYSMMVEGRLVTAVGEVPAQTVHEIATSMQLQGDID